MWNNDMRCKYMFFFLLKQLARKWLSALPFIWYDYNNASICLFNPALFSYRPSNRLFKLIWCFVAPNVIIMYIHKGSLDKLNWNLLPPSKQIHLALCTSTRRYWTQNICQPIARRPFSIALSSTNGWILNDQIMAWRRTAINTLRPRQDGRRFPDDTFERIFLNENVIILIKMSMKFVPNGPIDNIPALVQIMARRQAIIWINAG